MGCSEQALLGGEGRNFSHMVLVVKCGREFRLNVLDIADQSFVKKRPCLFPLSLVVVHLAMFFFFPLWELVRDIYSSQEVRERTLR